MSRAIRILTTAWAFFATLGLAAQSCPTGAPSAQAGQVTLADTLVCPGDSLRAEGRDQQDAAGFRTFWLVADSNGVIVVIDSLLEKIPGLPAGRYRWYAFNFATGLRPDPFPQLQAALNAVLTSSTGCYDLSTGVPFVVADREAPVPFCQPAVLFLDAAGTVELTPLVVDGGSTDACGGLLTRGLSRTSFSCRDGGDNLIVLTVTDAAGNTASCQTTVTIRDTIPPTLRCLPFTLYLGSDGLARAPDQLDTLASDNCTGPVAVSWAKSQFDCSDLGPQQVEMTAVDSAGNRRRCLVLLTIRDTLPPQLVCQSASLFLDENGQVVPRPEQVVRTASDNCGATLSYTFNPSAFTCNQRGNQSLVITLQDGSGNMARCTTTVTVFDTIRPRMLCRNDTLYLPRSGTITPDPQLFDAGSTDNCGVLLNLNLSQSTFTGANLGTTNVLLTAEDRSSNFSSCRATLTLVDTFPPEVRCQSLTVYLSATGTATLTPAAIGSQTTDNSGAAPRLELSPSSFTCANEGLNTVLLTATDSSGNRSSCQVAIEVADTTPPQVNCRPVTIYLDATGRAELNPDQVDDGTRDNCGGIARLELRQTAFTCADLGPQQRYLIATDRFGNTDSCQFTVEVRDTIRPQLQCRTTTIFLGSDGRAVLTPDLVTREASDNCGRPRVQLRRSQFTCTDRGEQTVTVVALDASGNVDSCQVDVLVVDQVKPVARCRNIKLYLAAAGTAELDPLALDGGSTDNCRIDSLAVSRSRFTCADLGENIVVLQVFDEEGNESSCPAAVEVLDTLAPVIQCPAPWTVPLSADGDANCDYTVTGLRLDPVAGSDNCQTLTWRHNAVGAPQDSSLQGAAFPPGRTAITWTATDGSGRSSSCVVELTVEDDVLPQARLRDTVVLELSLDGTATLDSSLVDLGSFDNCSSVRVAVLNGQFTCREVGYQRVVVEVRDAAGNTVEQALVVAIRASAACPPPRIANTAGPDIADPCTCRSEGLFAEEVVIGPALPRQDWRVGQTTLRDSVTLQPYPAGTRFQEIPWGPDSSIYLLAGYHRDGAGYTLEAYSPVFPTTLRIANRCYYPKPVVEGLDQAICLFTPPITLVGSGGGGVAGTGQFQINGNPATTFDPRALGRGQHQVSYRFDAGSPAKGLTPDSVGCVTTLTQTVEVLQAPSSFACYSDISINSNSVCQVLITPDFLLSGKFPCYDDYEVVLQSGNQLVPNPVPPQYIGQTITGFIRYRPDPSIGTCRTNIRLVDLSGPQFRSCPSDVTSKLICSDYALVFNQSRTIDPRSKYFTGRPEVEDACSSITLTFSDAILPVAACDPRYGRAILRTFVARDRFGNTSSCQQRIYFSRPTAVFFPKDTLVKTNCTGPALAVDARGNLSSSVAGTPFVINGFGEKVSLATNVCDWAIAYEDVRFDNCRNRYALLRTWRVIDPCNGNAIQTQQQFIEVGDYDAPIVSCPRLDLDNNGRIDETPTYPVAAFACAASVPLPRPEISDCSPTTVQTEIYAWTNERDAFGFPTGRRVFAKVEVPIVNGVAQNVPPGEYYFLFRVEDACTNVTRDTCLFRVVDRVAPTMICNSNLNLSLGGAGFARVLISDLNQGSRDNCDQTNLKLEIRRLIPAECQSSGQAGYSEWGSFADFDCCDVGKLATVELRGTDLAGNTNTCLTRFRIEDKLPPTCVPPADVTVNCNALPPGFNPTQPTSLQQRFGVPTVTDNCGAEWEELSPEVNLSTCGVGRILRRFRSRDASGNFSNQICEQTITVAPVNDYEIKFPRDVTAYCGAPIADTLELKANACDVLAVNVENREFVVPGGGCYQILRTFRVINWCEYDNVAEPIILPRDADCDQLAGEEALFLLRRRNGVTYLDRDNQENNNLPGAGQKSPLCDGQSNPVGHWANSTLQPTLRSRGYWQYTQVITVVDTVKPVVEYQATGPICSENNSTCDALVRTNFRVIENCTPTQLNIVVSLDQGSDGRIDRVLSSAEVQGQYPNYQVVGTLPIGRHAYQVEVRDACGNLVRQRLELEVIDCKGPVPICINGLSAPLRVLPQQTDVDGDGQVDVAAVVLQATDFIASPVLDCSGPVRISINREGQPPNPNQTQLSFTCNNEGITLVEIYAWDQANNPRLIQPGGRLGGPNFGFCRTFVDIQNPNNACLPIPKGSIGGNVITDAGVAIPQVEIVLSDITPRSIMTSTSGQYRFDNLVEGNDYSVTPRLDGDDGNGVSTFDLIMIRRHILGVELLSSPYRILAADANNSRSVTTLDMVLLQRLILGLDTELTQNTSWRFVDAGFNFRDPLNPWQDPIPEVININNLVGQQIGLDFIAIKIGDVNGSVILPGQVQGRSREQQTPLLLRIREQAAAVGDTLTIPVGLPPAAQLAGYQFGLVYDPTALTYLRPRPGLSTTEQIVHHALRGEIRANWVAERPLAPGDTLAFSLQFVVRRAVSRLAEVLQLDGRQLAPEAYPLVGQPQPLAIDWWPEASTAKWSHQARLEQNTPNPFAQETTIAYHLPAPGWATLQISDATGRIHWQQSQWHAAGRHLWTLGESLGARLPAGWLVYTLQTPTAVLTRKMIKIAPADQP